MLCVYLATTETNDRGKEKIYLIHVVVKIPSLLTKIDYLISLLVNIKELKI